MTVFDGINMCRAFEQMNVLCHTEESDDVRMFIEYDQARGLRGPGQKDAMLRTPRTAKYDSWTADVDSLHDPAYRPVVKLQVLAHSSKTIVVPRSASEASPLMRLLARCR